MPKIILLFIILIAQRTNAATLINAGNVFGTWTLAGSPYMIQGDIAVQSWHIMVIEPGVEIIFEGNYSFEINGILSARGTAAAPIIFKQNDTTGWHNDSIPNGGWHGFRFMNTGTLAGVDTCVLQYCKIQDVKHAANGSGIIPNNAIYTYQRNLLIDNCVFNHNMSMNDGRIIYYGTSATDSVTILNSEFYDNISRVAVIGGENFSGSGTTIVGCKIHHNSSQISTVFGIFNNLTFENNEVYENNTSLGSTIQFINGYTIVRKNKFHHNTNLNKACVTSTAGRMLIEQNLFCNNYTVDGYCGLTDGGAAIHLAHNSTMPWDSTFYIVRNNVIANNRANFAGSGIFFNDCEAIVTNNHFVNNFADGFGGTLFSIGSMARLDIRNNLFWGNISDSSVHDFIFYDGDSIKFTNNWVDKSINVATNFSLWSGIITDTTNNKIGITPSLINPTNAVGLLENALTKNFSISAATINCINQGIIHNQIGNFDYWNNQRIFAGAIDIGAFELQEIVQQTFIKTLNTTKFEIYPNPAKDFIKLSFNENDYKTIMLINSYCQIVDIRIEKGLEIMVPLQSLATGVYNLFVSDKNNHTSSAKFLLEK